ncbi:MAG: filamentous hemagglutinin N-terminal domain-containing protein [Verrucomicrobia bacterium]|nr:filamentous hemagglutinin N-terminal domain-containing protein [Verrucomicrobiota bacterium]
MSKLHFCLSLAIALGLISTGEVHAQPQGFHLVEGEARAPFVDWDGCLVVKVGRNAMINWDSFSVDSHENLRFEQEDAESSVMNFVKGESLSAIHGNVQSNGKVYLAHPNGVRIGSQGVLSAPQIILVAEQGKIEVNGALTASAPSGMGGKIHVLGKEVDIQESAVIDASGAAGEGEVLIGGSFQGQDRSILHAERTQVLAGAQISVDSLEFGNGGRAIIWSDDSTQFAGHVNARGGVQGGDGGFVEVSGREQLAFKGTVTTMAPKGKTGQLLLDPRNVLITESETIYTGAIVFSQKPGTDFTVDIYSVFDALNTTGVLIQANNNITLRSDFTFGPPTLDSTLVLLAGNSISMEGSFKIRLGPVTFFASINNNKALPAYRTSGGPCFFKISDPEASISSTSGNILVGAISALFKPAEGAVIKIHPGSFSTETGKITVNPKQPTFQRGPGPLPSAGANFEKMP